MCVQTFKIANFPHKQMRPVCFWFETSLSIFTICWWIWLNATPTDPQQPFFFLQTILCSFHPSVFKLLSYWSLWLYSIIERLPLRWQVVSPPSGRIPSRNHQNTVRYYNPEAFEFRERQKCLAFCSPSSAPAIRKFPIPSVIQLLLRLLISKAFPNPRQRRDLILLTDDGKTQVQQSNLNP